MGAALSLDLRKRVVAFCAKPTSTISKASEIFGVHRTTIYRLLKQHSISGSLLGKKHGGYRRRIVDTQWLKEHVKQYPSARLRDRADAYAQARGVRVSHATIANTLHAIGWSYKKKRFLPRNEKKSE